MMKSILNRLSTKWKFIILVIIALIIVLSFFLYGNIFQIWGKKSSDLPVIVNIIFYAFFLIIFLYLYIFYKFMQNNPTFFEK